MNKYLAVKNIKFCAAHRLHKYKGACANIHGHNYIAEIHVEVEQLDSLGMAVDFKLLKETIGEWIDENWDHALLFHKDDSNLNDLLGYICADGETFKHFKMPYNPTAENMAKYLLETVNSLFIHHNGFRILKVRIWETDTSYAEAIRDA